MPEGGFGDRLNAMHGWHHARDIPAVRGQSRRENGRDYVRWCFADLVTAALLVRPLVLEPTRPELEESPVV